VNHAAAAGNFLRKAFTVLTVTVVIGPWSGCRARDADSSTAKPRTDPLAATQTPGSLPRGHDPAHPPIDCPLRKQGIDPTHLRPFEDVEKYIAFLERADREAWQKPDEVVRALGLKGTETVFDLGAGSGYFSFRFAKALGAGRVIAADTEAEMVRHIHHRAMSEGVSNIEAKLIPSTDPGVSADADLVFVCDVLHHVADRPAWLAKLAGEMKSGARLVLIEGPPAAAKIPRAELVELATRAGFVLDAERKELLPYQVFLLFKKP
jgi:SAM-dependent methyltransferase